MQLHADVSSRVVVAAADMPWTVRDDHEEKLFELADGRYTALVRLSAGSRLALAAPVDLLVLDGELHDQQVTHAAGTYLHRSGATRISSARGCTVFVKQRAAIDSAHLTIDTARVEFSAHGHGISIARLYTANHGCVALLRFDPGATIGRHVHALGEEFFVLSGDLADEHGTYRTHAWVRQPPGSSHSVCSESGVLMFVFADHLAKHASRDRSTTL